MSHHCHALGCRNACPPRFLMCRTCWATVPEELAAEVNRTVKSRRKAMDATWAPWWRAQARARHHVACLQKTNPNSALWLERQLAFADKLEARDAEEAAHG